MFDPEEQSSILRATYTVEDVFEGDDMLSTLEEAAGDNPDVLAGLETGKYSVLHLFCKARVTFHMRAGGTISGPLVETPGLWSVVVDLNNPDDRTYMETIFQEERDLMKDMLQAFRIPNKLLSLEPEQPFS